MAKKEAAPKAKKVPSRRCVVTGAIRPKAELIRVVHTPDGAIVPDPTGRMKGRGAYVTKSREVIQQAMKKHSLDRSLGVEVPDAVYALLLSLVEAHE